jgi:hypothetical protein
MFKIVVGKLWLHGLLRKTVYVQTFLCIRIEIHDYNSNIIIYGDMGKLATIAETVETYTDTVRFI